MTSRVWVAVAGIAWMTVVITAYFINNQAYFLGKISVMGRFLGVNL
jgi:hypothetical protein